MRHWYCVLANVPMRTAEAIARDLDALASGLYADDVSRVRMRVTRGFPPRCFDCFVRADPFDLNASSLGASNRAKPRLGSNLNIT